MDDDEPEKAKQWMTPTQKRHDRRLRKKARRLGSQQRCDDYCETKVAGNELWEDASRLSQEAESRLIEAICKFELVDAKLEGTNQGLEKPKKKPR